MRRRDFIAGLGGAVAMPLLARAQDKMRRVGVLMHTVSDEPEAQARVAAFQQGLQAAGWSIGQNLRIDTRWSANDLPRLRRQASELIGLGPDVVLAGIGNTAGVLQEASSTVPIVMAQTIDPVGAGNIVSLARPGTNATGFAQFEYNLSGKWLELLKEIAPQIKRVGVLRDPRAAASIGQWAVIQAVAPALGVELRPINVPGVLHIDRAINAFADGPDIGLIVVVSGASPDSARPDHPARGPAPAARGLSLQLLRQRRRPDFLWTRSAGQLPGRRRLRRPHLAGRQAGRPAGADADQVRTCDQSQDRKGARPRRAVDPAATRRRGDRVSVALPYPRTPSRGAG